MKKCPFCAEEIQDEAIECKHCGEWMSLDREQQFDHQISPRHLGFCERCGQQRNTIRGAFHENISYIFERKERHIDAKLCLPCTTKVFASFTVRTLFGTWWGVIGAMVGPVYIVQNLGWFFINLSKFTFSRR